MNLTRIPLLFSGAAYDTNRERLTDVLTACCKAARAKAHYELLFSIAAHMGLTDPCVRFSIDEVMAQLPNHYGTPATPDCRKKYRIYQVLATLEALKAADFIVDEDDSYEGIALTNNLFSVIAEEWAYQRGARPHRISDSKIFAPTLALAMTIAERRLRRMASRKEVCDVV